MEYGGSRIHHGKQRIQEMFKGSRVSSGYLPNGLTYECNMFGIQASTWVLRYLGTGPSPDVDHKG